MSWTAYKYDDNWWLCEDRDGIVVEDRKTNITTAYGTNWTLKEVEGRHG